MATETELKRVVECVLAELNARGVTGPVQQNSGAGGYDSGFSSSSAGGDCLPDIIEEDFTKQILVPNPQNREALLALKSKSPARLGQWRAGPRPKTSTMLRFRADHAAAQDAVFTDVSEEFLQRLGLKTVQTKCADKDDYLAFTEKGKAFDEAAIREIKNIVGASPKVLVYVADGLSSTAIEANAADCLMAIRQGLEAHGITMAPSFFVKYGRVPAQDIIGDITGAEAVCVLIGERPGLITAESMSAYLSYKPTAGMPESRRNVVSNIHKGGTPAVEAGAYIADLLKMMLDKRASGLDLKL